MQFLSNILIGLVAVMIFLIVTHILGYLSIKYNIVHNDNDNEPIGAGCAMWVVIAVLVFVFWFIGYAINAFFL